MTGSGTATTPVIVAARRTPVATAGRGLSDLDAAGLAAPVLAALAADLSAATSTTRSGAHPIDDVILGNARGPGGNVARVTTLAAGLADTVPAVTVDRQCGSGLEAIRLAAALVAGGAARVVLAGGTESASTGPAGRAPFTPAGFADPDMGPAAEELARRCGIDRRRQDAYAARSHQLALAAAAHGGLDSVIVPVAGTRTDDRPRARMTESVLSRLRPAFAPDGTVTAGNSCGISDGAAAVAVVDERIAIEAGLPGLRVLGSAVAGVDPAMPGLGAVPAARAVLDRAGLDLDEVAVLEITEAFAAQLLACTDALGLDPLGADAGRVCPRGGAIATGHPWGASGAILVVSLFATLVAGPSPAGRYGLATCAIGGGQGVALLVEAVR